MVLQICLGYMKGDLAKAQDLSQEVFINTWNALSKFRGESSHKTWIYRITVNTCLMQIRKEKNQTQFSMNPSDHEVSVDPHQDHHSLYQAIGKLSDTDRVLIMLVLEELQYGEIAQILGISEGTLRVKIHRIKKRLKKLIEHE